MRVIGGRLRGRNIAGPSTQAIRPTQDRLRESLFNILTHAYENPMLDARVLDLFAGTGALGLEAISRGSVFATFIERHIPTARVIEENIKGLGVEQEATLLMTSAFLWGKRDLPAFAAQHAETPWLVFCSPPYDFFVERQEETLGLIAAVMEHCPPDSIVVTESDERFDATLLPSSEQYDGVKEWDVRTYSPAVVGIWQKKA